MDRSFVEAVREGADGATYHIGDEEFSTVALHRPPKPPREDVPEALEFATLGSFAEYVRGKMDAMYRESRDGFVLVESPSCVVLNTTVFGDRNQRETLARCTFTDGGNDIFTTAEFLDPEDFNIGLQVNAHNAGDRAAVLKVAGNVSNDATRQHADDGVKQEVTVREGPRLAVAEVSNPVLLAFRCTFPELDPILSPYVFRARGGGDKGPPQLALFDASDGTWHVSAVKAIKAWLEMGGGLLGVLPVYA